MDSSISVNVKISKHHEESENWEDHIILRVPPEVANRMEKAVYNAPDAEELGIHINEDSRNVQIRIGNQILPAKLMDLPTISEVHKTFDNKTIYKVTDVSQIIICDGEIPTFKKDRKKLEAEGVENVKPEESEFGTGTSTERQKTARQIARERVKKLHFPHGITPPMKNVKKRRFRKKKEKKTMAVEEIEKELRRLLRSDLEAQSVRWEIVEDDGTKEQEDEEEEGNVYDADDNSDLDKDDDGDLNVSNDDDETF